MVSENNRRIAKNTILLYVRTLFSQLLGLYTSRKFLEILGVEDYGIYNVVGGVISLLLFFNGSMAVATQRYLTIELGKNDLKSYNNVFSMACIIHAVLALFVLILAETVGLWFMNSYLNIPVSRMSAANMVYQASVFTVVLSILVVPYTASLTSHERLDVYAFVGMGEAILRLGVVYLLLISTYDSLVLYGFLLFVIQLISAFIYIVFCTKIFKECRFHWLWNTSLFRSMLGFTGWNLFGTLAWILKDQGNNLLLNIFGGPLINAARGVSFQVSGAVHNLVSSFSSAVNPQLTKSYAADDKDGLYKLFVTSSKMSFFLLFFISLPVIIEIPFLLDIWLVEVPEYTVLFTRIILFESVINTLSGPMITSLLATGKIKLYQIVVGGVMLINVPFSFLLLYLGFPIVTPFVVSFIVIVVSIVVRLYFCKQLLSINRISYVKDVVKPVTLVLVFSSILPLIVSNSMDYGFLKFFTTSIISIISILICVYTFGLSNNERVLVKNMVLSKIKFKKL